MLLVDDEPAVLRGATRVITASFPDFVVLTARSGRQALEHLSAQSIDVILTDLLMPEMDGQSLLEIVKRQYPETIRVIHSSQTETLDRQRLSKLCDRALPKPAGVMELRETLRWVLERRNRSTNPGRPAAS